MVSSSERRLHSGSNTCGGLLIPESLPAPCQWAGRARMAATPADPVASTQKPKASMKSSAVAVPPFTSTSDASNLCMPPATFLPDDSSACIFARFSASSLAFSSAFLRSASCFFLSSSASCFLYAAASNSIGSDGGAVGSWPVEPPALAALSSSARAAKGFSGRLLEISFREALSVGMTCCKYAASSVLPSSCSLICSAVGMNCTGAGPFLGLGIVATNGMNVTPPMYSTRQSGTRMPHFVW
mmetsp:Transcript_15840/g.40827  ORF Transcript_15840/g.40827 Transcript_15840/m.40827 type:complete len:242 (+) Transcript_15840:288-1013(+)